MTRMSNAWIARLDAFLRQNRSKVRVVHSQVDGMYHVQEPYKDLGKRQWRTVHRAATQRELAEHLGVGEPQ